MKFIDEAKSTLQGRRRRQRHRLVPPREIRAGRRPDGGDGGRAAAFTSSPTATQHLIDYRYTRKFLAQRGENGGSSDCYGKGGKTISPCACRSVR
jgi:GTP-binding protein